LGARQIFLVRETTESLQKIQIEKKVSIPWKKILIIAALIIAGVAGYYLYRNLQQPVSPPVTFPATEESVEHEISEYETYKHEIYGYDMISSDESILRIIVFDDQNENGVMDSNEKSLQGIHLDQYWNDEFFGGSMTSESGAVNFFELPLNQKVTISLPVRDNKYWGWQTAFKEGWPVTTVDKYEFILTEIPKETKIIYFGLKKVEEPVKESIVPLIEEKPTQACVEVIKNGDPSNKINVVFIGDGYSNDETDLFNSDVDKFIDEEGAHRGLLSIEPFKSYQSHFNFYRIDKSYGFDCTKGSCDFPKTRAAAKIECPNLDELVVLVNVDEICAGAISHFCWVEREHPYYIDRRLGYEEWEFSAQTTFVHEFGHSFGDLADEYSNMGAISRLDRVNCDVKGCPEWCSGEIDTSKPCYQLIVKFEDCVDNGKSSKECYEEVIWEPGGSKIEACDIGVNCLEGTGCVWNCKGTNGYKPTSSYVPNPPEGWEEILCKMISPEYDVFCPVCQRHLIEVIENYKK